MKMSEMELLVRVANSRSMTQAAEQLHLTAAAVSAAIRRIEEAIGVRLFERTTRSLRPTDEGLVIIEGCRDVIDRWRRALDDVRGERAELEGTIRLSAPADTTYTVLASVVETVCAANPKLRVVLHISDVIQHLHRDAIDIAIRYGPLEDSSLTAHRLVVAPGILVAAPSYIDKHGAPVTPDELVRHRCLTLQRSGGVPSSWPLVRDRKVGGVRIDSPLCSDGYLARRWAVEGLGIALKNVFDVIDDLEHGRLVRVLPEYARPGVTIHALLPSRRFLPARVRVLSSAIAAHFAARAARCDAWLEATS